MAAGTEKRPIKLVVGAVLFLVFTGLLQSESIRTTSKWKNGVVFEKSVPIRASDFRDASPFVLEDHKLVFIWFPKVGCTVWKRLFRRMMGYTDWNTKNPHPANENGLVVLDDLDPDQVTRILNAPDWTVVMILRDPKDRLLSAYLDKIVRAEGKCIRRCCNFNDACMNHSRTLPGFVELIPRCPNVHWRPQALFVPNNVLPVVDFVGHMETIQQDAKRLLTRLGVWQEFGQSGWGVHGNESIFASKSHVEHSTSNDMTDMKSRLAKYYTPELEKKVEDMYAIDYSFFHLNMTKISFPISSVGW
jgi:hypothetical protein